MGLCYASTPSFCEHSRAYEGSACRSDRYCPFAPHSRFQQSVYTRCLVCHGIVCSYYLAVPRPRVISADTENRAKLFLPRALPSNPGMRGGASARRHRHPLRTPTPTCMNSGSWSRRELRRECIFFTSFASCFAYSPYQEHG